MTMCITGAGAAHPWEFQWDDLSVHSRLEKRPLPLLQNVRQLCLLFLLWCGLLVLAPPAHSQTGNRKRFLARTATRQVRASMAIFSGSGMTSVHAFKSMV
jgi:hypothetical protein